MILDVAGFGEIKGGHALLGSSSNRSISFSDIVGRSDRPAYGPPGISWNPYISGFPFNSSYILMKTFQDRAATRAGMVFSYALAVDLGEIVNIDDISPILDLLPNSIEKPDAYAPVQVDLSRQSLPKRLNRQLAERLVATSTNETIVWLGELGFTDAMVALWSNSWPATRAQLSFRLAFDPQDLTSDHPTVVLTPSELSSRWAGQSIVDFSVLQPTIAGAALAGDPDGEPLRALKNSLQAEIKQYRELRHLDKVYQSLTRESLTTSEARSVLHIIGALCPDAQKGKAEKASLLEKSARAIRDEQSPSEIWAFRNLKLIAFPDVESLITAITQWATLYLFDGPPTEQWNPLFEITFASESYLSVPLRRGIQSKLQGNERTLSGLLWSWSSKFEGHAKSLIEQAILAGWEDCAIATECPSRLDPNVGKELARYLRTENFFLSWIAVLTGFLEPDAVIEQLLEESATISPTVVKLLLGRIGPVPIILFAIDNPTPEATSLAVQALLAFPNLVNSIQVTSTAALGLVQSAVEAGVNVMGNCDGPRMSHQILDFAIAGISIGASLWANVAYSKYVDLFDYTSRQKAWRVLPASVSHRFVEATSERWVSEFLSRRDGTLIIEDDLQDGVLAAARQRQLGVSDLLLITGKIAGVTEGIFITWMERAIRDAEINIDESESLGRILVEKNWKRAASHLFELSEHRPDLNAGISECLDLLGRWQRLRAIWIRKVHRQSNADRTDIWSALEDIGSELYPWGPGDRDIWERAGGDRSAIRVNTNGRDSWRDVLSQGKHGGGGDVTARSLVKAMLKDYGWNDVLLQISKQLQEEKY
jgi:GTPase-associated protein 1, N-terminal domain type 1/Effector-associated domain 1